MKKVLLSLLVAAISLLLAPKEALGVCCRVTRPALGVDDVCWHRPALGIGNGQVSLWGYGDYMYLWRRKRFIPPLVTTSPLGTPPNVAGRLGFPTTTILFGDENIQDSPKSGGRGAIGVWLDQNNCFGFGATYFGVGQEKNTFRLRSDVIGVPTIARPFFNVSTGVQDASLIAFDVTTTGAIDIDITNNVSGADGYFAHRVWDACCLKIDSICGYTYVRITDNLQVNTTSRIIQILNPNFGTVTNIQDKFRVINEFQGALLGFDVRAHTSRWTLKALGKMNIGGMYNKVLVSGRTEIIPLGFLPIILEEGLFALGTNIGKHTRNRFSIMPELDVKLLYCLWRRLNVSLGYTIYYWDDVALAGDQVDLDLNLTQQGGNPLIGPARPRVDIKTTSFWLQGITAGLSVCF